jgi:hypothetical protein
LSIGNIVGISALMHMDNTLKGTDVEFNKNKFRLFLDPPSYVLERLLAIKLPRNPFSVIAFMDMTSSQGIFILISVLGKEP